MEFIPLSGVDDTDLRVVAARLIGTQDNVMDHIGSLGTEIGCISDVLDDLSRYTDTCDECDCWTAAMDLDCGLCTDCYEMLESEMEYMLDDDYDDFGFDDSDFDDDDIFDEMYEDHWFDETDDEEDDL